MAITFQRATKRQARLRMAIDGPSGSGKTYTALTAAFALAGEQGGVAVIDTEHGSASKYADLFPPFDVLELGTFHPQQYVDGIAAAEQAGYTVIVIDSLSHAWEGESGVLELHDQATKRSQSGNSFTAWKDITPIHRKLVDAMLQSSCHIIATMRSKMEYIQTEDDKGRKIIKKVGMAPIQRQGIEYEMDVVADMDVEHNMVISKSRCFAIADQVVSKPTAAWFTTLKAWLTDGAPVPPPPPQPTTPPAPQPVAAPATTSAQKPAATQPQPTTQGYSAIANGTPRPYDAAHLKERFTGVVLTRKSDAPAEGYRGLIASALELCFAGQADSTQKVHSLVKFLTGRDSRNDLTPQELRAFGLWLQMGKDSGGALQINGDAYKEAQAVITQVMKDAGQGELPLDEQPSGEELAEMFDQMAEQEAAA